MFGKGNAQSCYCPCQRYERVGYGQILMRLSLLFMVILAYLTAFSPMTTYYSSLISSPLLFINSLTILPAFVPTTIL